MEDLLNVIQVKIEDCSIQRLANALKSFVDNPLLSWAILSCDRFTVELLRDYSGYIFLKFLPKEDEDDE